MYGSYDAAFGAKIGTYDDFVQGLPISEYGEHRVGSTVAVASPGVLSNMVIAPGDCIDLPCKTPFDHIVLSIKPASLHSKLDALTGSSTGAPLNLVKRATYDGQGASL